MNRILASALIVLTSLATFSPSHAQQPKTGKVTPSPAPKQNVKRLQPSELVEQVSGLPAEFVEKLNTRSCTIPQFDDMGSGTSPTAPTNVIEGEFAKKGQKDWAVLCSNGKTSTIVIFWSKPTPCPSQLARLDDEHFMQKGADKNMHYSRSVYASDPARDASLHRGPKEMTHQGIYDAFVGKSSSLFYCNEGKWRIYPGAD